MCAQGYQPSLAAGTLQEIGIRAATDMVGGFEAWVAAGPTVNPQVAGSIPARPISQEP